MEHMEEWRTNGDDVNGHIYICDNSGNDIMATFYHPMGGLGIEEAKANAQRTIDCVNACKGINPEAVPQLYDACKTLRDLTTIVFLLDKYQEHKDEVRKIVTQIGKALALTDGKDT